MNFLPKILYSLKALLTGRRMDEQLSAEVRAHVEMATEANVAKGMSLEDARYAALREFGNVAGIQERTREERGWVWLEQGRQDVRYAFRAMRKNPGFTAVAIVSLALGMGANTAIFGVINELLLKPLPVPHPYELVRFNWAGDIVRNKIAGSFHDVDSDPRTGHVGETFTFLAFQRFREGNETLGRLFAYTTIGGHTALVDGQAEIVGDAEYVSGEYFETLEVGAVVGRPIASPDDRIESPPVAMISHAYWLKRFGGDMAVLGKTILVNATPVTIIGVTPPEFRGAKAFGGAPALFLPLTFVDRLNPGAANIAAQPGFRWLFGVIGRLKPGVTSTQATANFAELFRQSVLDGSAADMGHDVDRTMLPADFPRLGLEQGNNGSDQIRRASGKKLIILAALMGLVLLIACINVANLLLARSAARRREIAVRMALGAGRFRLVRQLLTESLLLAVGGGLLGVAMASWGADLLAVMLQFGGVENVELDWRVLGFAAAVSLLTGLLFGLVPALRATRLDLTAEFQGGARTVGAGSTLRLGRWLMVSQLALSFIVLTGAGLFLLTLRNLRSADVGFARDHLLLFRLDAAPAGYKREQFASLFGRIADEVSALPGVSAAAYSSVPVVGGVAEFYGVQIPGSPITAGEHPPAAAVNEVGGDFFAAYNLPPMLGRTLDARDEAKAAMVAVVNQAMADKFFPGENPVGRHFTAGRGEREIVGVVRDINYRDVREPVPPTVYSPFAQAPAGRANFAVRTTLAPDMLVSAVRQVVRTIDPKLPVANVRTQDEQMERLFAEERIFAWLSSVLGALALALVCVGLYGLMSYATLRRTNEIGVRMALGAQPGRVFKMILSESLTLVLAGVIMGIVGAYGATRLIASMLYGLAPADPLAYGCVALLLAAVALFACWLPARRAAKVDPVVALRAE